MSRQRKISIPSPKTRDDFENLLVQFVTVNTARITATRISVEDRILDNVDETADIAVSGAGGLDTGVEANTVWYYIWLICDDLGTDVALMFSLSASAPVMPSGFTKKRLVSAVRNQGTGNFKMFRQYGRKYLLAEESENPVLSAGQAIVWTIVSVTTCAPSFARCLYIDMVLQSTAGAPTYHAGYVGDGGLTLTSGAFFVYHQAVVGDAAVDTAQVLCGCDASQNIAYKMNVAPATGGLNLYCAGFEVPL